MRKLLCLAMLLACFATLRAQSPVLDISISSPSVTVPQHDSITITVSVKSTYQVASVVAVVGNQQMTLPFNNVTQNFTGVLAIAALPQDSLLLTITATDIMKNQSVRTLKFLHDNAPEIFLDSPLAMTVARPTVSAKARCRDNMKGCVVTISAGISSFSGQDSVSATFDLSSEEGLISSVSASAKDKYGQTANAGVFVLVENSPYLTEIYTAKERIIDFNYGKILTAKVDYNAQTKQNKLSGLKVISLLDSTIDTIPYTGVVGAYADPGLSSSNSLDFIPPEATAARWLTPYGATFISVNGDSTSGVTLEWNAHKLNTVSISDGPARNYSSNLLVAGEYAFWKQTTPGKSKSDSIGRFVLRNLTTGTNTVVTDKLSLVSSDLPQEGQLAPDGTVLIVSPTAAYPPQPYPYITYMYKGGGLKDSIRSFITSATPKTDGKRVVYAASYQKSSSGVYIDSSLLYLYDGKMSSLLVNLGNLRSMYGFPTVGDLNKMFQLNRNFLAFCKAGPSLQTQIWVRDSTGADKQMTFFGSNSFMENLGTNGDIMSYSTVLLQGQTSRKRRYLTSYQGSSVKEISSANFGTPYQWGNDWYIAIGRTLFRVNVNAVAPSVTDFTVNAYKDSSIRLSTQDFVSHYNPSGQFTTFKLETVPRHGKLLIGNNPASVISAGFTENRTYLDQIFYKPDAGYTGTDSIRWSASNGISSTASGLVTFLVKAPVQPPAIPATAAVKSSYCNNEGVQKVRIVNLPDTSVQVNVMLDATRLTIASDSTVSFNPADYSAGPHAIVLQYSNAAGSNSTRILLTIVPAVTPDVDVSTSISLVTDLAVPIVVTAANKSGGGSSPLFTFSSDRAFSNILQAEGSAATCTLNGSSLAVGDNWIYVRMKTSETCYTSASSIDSLLVRRDQTTGIIDPDNPSSVITVFPNPFGSYIKVSGLSPGKSYTIVLYSLQGIKLGEQQVHNNTAATLYKVPVAKGVYWLVIQDERRKRQLGRVQLVNR